MLRPQLQSPPLKSSSLSDSRVKVGGWLRRCVEKRSPCGSRLPLQLFKTYDFVVVPLGPPPRAVFCRPIAHQAIALVTELLTISGAIPLGCAAPLVRMGKGVDLCPGIVPLLRSTQACISLQTRTLPLAPEVFLQEQIKGIIILVRPNAFSLRADLADRRLI